MVRLSSVKIFRLVFIMSLSYYTGFLPFNLMEAGRHPKWIIQAVASLYYLRLSRTCLIDFFALVHNEQTGLLKTIGLV